MSRGECDPPPRASATDDARTSAVAAAPHGYARKIRLGLHLIDVELLAGAPSVVCAQRTSVPTFPGANLEQRDRLGEPPSASRCRAP